VVFIFYLRDLSIWPIILDMILFTLLSPGGKLCIPMSLRFSCLNALKNWWLKENWAERQAKDFTNGMAIRNFKMSFNILGKIDFVQYSAIFFIGFALIY